MLKISSVKLNVLNAPHTYKQLHYKYTSYPFFVSPLRFLAAVVRMRSFLVEETFWPILLDRMDSTKRRFNYVQSTITTWCSLRSPSSVLINLLYSRQFENVTLKLDERSSKTIWELRDEKLVKPKVQQNTPNTLRTSENTTKSQHSRSDHDNRTD